MSSNSAQINSRNKSLGNVATSVAPVQFAVMANITVTESGYYKIRSQYGYGATAESTTADNFALVVNNTTITTLPATVGNANTFMPSVEFYVNLSAGDVVKIITANAASASSVYKTFLILDKMNP